MGSARMASAGVQNGAPWRRRRTVVRAGRCVAGPGARIHDL